MSHKVYFIDDETLLLENYQDALSSEDLEVKTFDDPRKAIEEIKLNPPDLLFIDFRLPGMTGDDVAKELDPSIPKVLMTGDLQPNVGDYYVKILSKPCRFADLKAFIESRLN